MLNLTLSYYVSCPRAMMACHAQCHLTICAVQGFLWHVTPAVVRPCVFSKDYESMQRQTLSDLCAVKGR